MSSRCHPNCQRAAAAKEDGNFHLVLPDCYYIDDAFGNSFMVWFLCLVDSAERAATVAANLISTARVILKLDREFTEYSAQFLVDNALVEKMEKQQQRRSKITVKDCLECAFKEGIPRYGHWAHLGCVSPVPPFASLMPRVPVKGEAIEAKELKDAFELLEHGPVGAKLHVFSPEIDLVGENGVYRGPSSNGTSYVGLRDVILVAAEKIKGEAVGTVKIRYKKETSFMNVSLSQMFTRLAQSGDESQTIEPTGLLVDFIVLRLSQ
ncbi:unnamed protein product [Brassica napus]|uniref:(rape) hypothetical protein n=1 Tax=Brassica napus TaxID=3708 RepID=A0A816IKS6_BRANA|nr:unnamed protein product [Brassica napus]